jgi:hypothetical protein
MSQAAVVDNFITAAESVTTNASSVITNNQKNLAAKAAKCGIDATTPAVMAVMASAAHIHA